MSANTQADFVVTAVYDRNAEAWNVNLETDGFIVVFAATDRGHAQSIAKKISESVWVDIHRTSAHSGESP